jgi:undecaprenyl-diphosphatase
MYWGTKSVIWLPVYLFILYMVIDRYKWNSLWVLLFAALMITASDQLSVLAKEFFARPRPSHEPGLTGIHTVYNYTGGTYGFYSSHASNTMSVAIFTILMLRGTYRWFPWLMILWACFMSYTRIYLGVHYPGDILTGLVAGIILGWIAAVLCEKVIRRFSGSKIR